MASKRIRFGDESYGTIWQAWVANGRSCQFDREGKWGGALYRVHVPEGVAWDAETSPDFYQYASLGPTEIDSKGKVVKEGWHLASKRDGFGVELWLDDQPGVAGSQVKVRHRPMPNEL